MENNEVDELPPLPEGKAREKAIEQIIKQYNEGTLKLSYSSIKQFMRSPKDFIDYKIGVKETTDSMAFGTMLHCLILQPHLFEEKYTTDTDICAEIGGAKPRATSKYKEWVSGQKKIIVAADDLELAKKMAEAVRTNRAVFPLLERLKEFESSIEFTYKGFIIRGFTDASGDDIIIDVKMTKDAEFKAFQREIVNLGYWMQAGIYDLHANREKQYYLIAVDKRLSVSVHLMEEEYLDFAGRKLDSTLEDFENCVMTNSFNSSLEYRAQMDSGIYIASKPPYLT